MIGIDMLAWFVPSFVPTPTSAEERKAATVRGHIVYVNYAHKVFMVEWEDGGNTFRESFNFSDCGKSVRVRGCI